METRVASLLVRASDLRRKIYSSLPWGFRLARIFQAISGAEKDNWAMMIGIIMLRAGVTDMPDPGPGWKPNNPRGSRLPRGYAGLDDLAGKAFGMALKGVGSPAIADDLLQDVVMGLWSKPTMKAVTLKEAKNYVLHTVKLAIMTQRKEKQHRALPTDEEGNDLDLVDDVIERNPYWTSEPRQFDSVKDALPEGFWDKEIEPELSAINPSMPFFFALLDSGYEMKEIVEGDMLPDWGSELYDLANPVEARRALSAWSVKVMNARKLIINMVRDYFEMDRKYARRG